MTSTRGYNAEALREFLRELDIEVAKVLPDDAQLELTIVGGAAAALAYGFGRATADIDFWSGVDESLLEAAREVRKRTGAQIGVESVRGVANVPWTFEDRLQPLHIDGLKHVRLKVPEAADLVVMKLVRGQPRDLQAARELVKSGITLETLIERMNETKYGVEGPAVLRLRFLNAIDELFGEAAAERAETLLDLE